MTRKFKVVVEVETDLPEFFRRSEAEETVGFKIRAALATDNRLKLITARVKDLTEHQARRIHPHPRTKPTIPLASGRCGSGWTNDRCTKPLGHSGIHSNE